jgi:serine phosphatase RsbU (regulator of sigma subunit)
MGITRVLHDDVVTRASISPRRLHILETRTQFRITVGCGLLFTVLDVFTAGAIYRQDAGIAAACAISSVVHAVATLEARRTRRHTVAAAVLGINVLATLAFCNFLGRAGPAAALDSVSILFLALVPQLTMYLLGARAGIVAAVASMTYLSAVFGWLLRHPESATDPELALKYVFANVMIIISFSLSLLYLRARTRMMAELREAHATADALRLAEQRRMKEELELAVRIQTALLPRDLRVEGLEISASMLPAAEVGGDYYDVLPCEGGAWLGIGDVAGHGLNAGLTMLMIQSAISAVVQSDPGRSPEWVLRTLNTTLYQNVRQRLRRDEHATLTVLRYHRDGTVLFAGAHEEILVFRAAEGRCEALPTPGPWVGARLTLASSVATSRLALHDGDILVLYTDGLTEAMDESRRQFGLERVEAEIVGARGQPVEAIRKAILGAVRTFCPMPDDDITLLVARYHAPASA